MNSRERMMTLVLILGIFVFLSFFVGYQFILAPIQDANRELSILEEEITKLEDKKSDVERGWAMYKVGQKKSLPADVDFSHREYQTFLETMIRRAKFSPTSIIVTPRQPDTKMSPTVAVKRPAYTRLQYDVQITGELGNLIDFLEIFYKQPLLHQVKSFSLQKTVSNRNRSGTDLEIKLYIEALILDRAEVRGTLMPVPSEIYWLGGGTGAYSVGAYSNVRSGGAPYQFEQVLATNQRRYPSITGKNLFFGPPPPPPKREVVVEEKPQEPDISPFIKLTSIFNVEGKRSAMLFDLYNNGDFLITANRDGSFRVDSFETINDRKMPVRPRPKYLEFGDREGGNFRQFKVVKLTDSELYLEEIDEQYQNKLKLGASLVVGGFAPELVPGKTLLLTVGKAVKDAQVLTTREVRQLLLTSESVKPDTKKPEL